MIYYLPTVHSNRQGFESIGALAKEAEDLFADHLELNMSQVSSFDANMAAPLGAILAQVADQFNIVEIVDVPDTVERVLRKNRFLTNYWYESLYDAHRITMPFRRLRLSDEGEFEEYIYRQLSGRGIPKMSEGASRVFKKRSLRFIRMPSPTPNPNSAFSSVANSSRTSIASTSLSPTSVSEYAIPSAVSSIIPVSVPSRLSNGHSSRITPRGTALIPVG